MIKTLSNLVRFFPYESVHASNSVFMMQDADMSVYNAIVKLLSRYEADEYVNCHPGYFNLAIDNKITLELKGPIYLTYWDGMVYISSVYFSFGTDLPKHCTVKFKRK